jgi:DHA2 family multidrug resistance protein
MALLFTVIIQREFVHPNVRKFDFVGFLSVVIFLPVLLYALSEGNSAGNSAGWSAPHILICFAISAIALAVFLTRELTTKYPLLELRLLADRNFGLANLFMLVFGLGMFGSTFLLPLYLQNTLGYTALQSGAVFLPVGIIQGLIAPMVGIVSDKTNPKIPLFVGISLLGISFILNYYLSYNSEHSFIMLSLYLRGLGMGMIFTPLSTMSLNSIPRDHMAQASSISNTVRQIGGSLGVAILSTMLTSRTNFHAQVYGQAIEANSQVVQNVTHNMAYYIQQHAGSPYGTALKQGQSILMQHVNIQAFIQGVDDDFFLAAMVTFVGFIPIIFLHTKKKNALKH